MDFDINTLYNQIFSMKHIELYYLQYMFLGNMCNYWRYYNLNLLCIVYLIRCNLQNNLNMNQYLFNMSYREIHRLIYIDYFRKYIHQNKMNKLMLMYINYNFKDKLYIFLNYYKILDYIISRSIYQIMNMKYNLINIQHMNFLLLEQRILVGKQNNQRKKYTMNKICHIMNMLDSQQNNLLCKQNNQYYYILSIVNLLSMKRKMLKKDNIQKSKTNNYYHHKSYNCFNKVNINHLTISS